MQKLEIKLNEFVNENELRLKVLVDNALKMIETKSPIKRGDEIDLMHREYGNLILELTKNIVEDIYSDNNFQTLFTKQTSGNYPFIRGSRALKGEASHVITFNSLYPNVILKLTDFGVLKYNHIGFNNYVIDIIKLYQHQDKKSKIRYVTKSLVNYIFGILCSDKVEYGVLSISPITQYSGYIFDMLNSFINEDIKFINIDQIYLTNYEKNKILIHYILDKIDLPYYVEKIPK